jgi:hypothetical protein
VIATSVALVDKDTIPEEVFVQPYEGLYAPKFKGKPGTLC